ncbi:MAG TPA: hypothetical protein VEY30_01885 [Myxococcaceae bacterium]|nr:hypothetical protein [Myxococcaceae bacterium]
MPKSFRETLDGVRPLLRLGDVRFRYEPSLLIAEVSRSRWKSPALPLLATSAAGMSAAVIIADPSQAGLAALLGLAAAAVAFWIFRRQSRSQGRHGFVFNFATETLRLDLPGGGPHGPRTERVPFDQVNDLLVQPSGAGTVALVLYFQQGRDGGGATAGEVLVDRIRPEEEEAELGRAFKTLRAALGLPEEEPFSSG